MRQPSDALRSVGRQLDLVLNEGPAVLAEVYWADAWDVTPDVRWTHRGMAPGALEVTEAQWTALSRSQLGPAEAEVAAGRRWERRKLLFDPRPGDLLGLPLAGTPAPAPSSLPVLEDDPWEVRYAAERGEVTFPFCRVSLPAAASTAGTARRYTVTQPMVVECYPSAEAPSAEAAVLAATDVIGTLLRGLRGEGAGDGRAARIPLYDYDGVPLTEGVTARRLEPDYLRVVDLAARVLPDAANPRRAAAVADLRVSWDVTVSHRGRERVVDSLRSEIAGS